MGGAVGNEVFPRLGPPAGPNSALTEISPLKRI